jgi:hypothetical protein
MEFLPSQAGPVAITRFFPGWESRDTSVVIVPGYFGRSRHGPYGLYSRLASQWALSGFESMTVDPLGSGDSAAITRTFDSEVLSVVTAVKHCLGISERVVVVGHSMGAATALKARHEINADGRLDVWCLAPLCTLEDLSRAFLSARSRDELLSDGWTSRHGLRLEQAVIDGATEAWRLLSRAEAIVVAGADIYTAEQDLGPTGLARLFTIDDADHNFSADGNADRLVDIGLNLLIGG